jgi:hypothetical protein
VQDKPAWATPTRPAAEPGPGLPVGRAYAAGSAGTPGCRHGQAVLGGARRAPARPAPVKNPVT